MKTFLLEYSLCLAVMLLAYRCILSGTSLHRFKRFYLLACLVVPLVMPFQHFSIYYGEAEVIPRETAAFSTPAIGEELLTENPEQFDFADSPVEKQSTSTNRAYWLVMAYLLIAFVLLIRLSLNIYRIWRLSKQSEFEMYQCFKVVFLKKGATPYSFFRLIFIGKDDFNDRFASSQLLSHEVTHARQWHSVDILALELLRALFWFNPLYLWLAKSIRLNHEYLADAQVIEQFGDRRSYQKLLLNFSGKTSDFSSLVSPSDFSFIKNRFTMMQKSTPQKTAALRILLLTIVTAGSILSIAMDIKPRPKIYVQASDEVMEPTASDQPTGFPIDSVYYSGDFSRLAPIPKLYMTDTYPGIDITSRKGRSVIATADGVVEEVSLNDKDYGKYVLIKHNEEFSTLYASLNDIAVEAGERVKLGQKLGSIGKSMVVHALSPHIYRVHYAVHQNGNWISPYNFLQLPPQPDSKARDVGLTGMPFGYSRSVDVVPDQRNQPNILPFEAEDRNYLAYTGMTAGKAVSINSLYDSSIGTEFFSMPNTGVIATADGVVSKVVTSHEQYGNYIVIKHDETHETMYAKLDRVTIRQGQRVKRGTVLGNAGNENDMFGRFHYKVKRDGMSMSPTAYFTPKGSQGPRLSLMHKNDQRFDWKFPSGFAFRAIQYDRAEAVFTKSSGETITKKPSELSNSQKAALLSLNSPPYPFPAKRPVPEEVYSRWENPSVYKIYIDGRVVKSEEMTKYQPSDFEHSSWVVVSKNVKKRNGHAFELYLQTKDYYEQKKSDHRKRQQQWRQDTKDLLSHFEEF